MFYRKGNGEKFLNCMLVDFLNSGLYYDLTTETKLLDVDVQ